MLRRKGNDEKGLARDYGKGKGATGFNQSGNTRRKS